MQLIFELNTSQIEKYNKWQESVYQKMIDEQRKNPPKNIPRELLESMWDDGFPYTGAIGGSTTFSFTPTSIGVVACVKDSVTGEEIDLTDYDKF